MGRHLRRMDTAGALIEAPEQAENSEEKDLLALYIRQISRYSLLTAADEQEIGETVMRSREELAGLESNQMRIEGDWYQVSSGIREFDYYTFNDKMIERNGETHGEYSFTSNEQIQVVLGSSTGAYTIEFPEADVMIWYQDVRGTRTPVIRWQR